MNRTVIIFPNAIFHDNIANEIISLEFEVKDVAKKKSSQEADDSQQSQSTLISTSKSFRSIILESVMDYARTVFDVHYSDGRDVGVSILLGDTTGNPIVLNDWSVEQQSFSYITSKFEEINLSDILEQLEYRQQQEREDDEFVAAMEVSTSRSSPNSPAKARTREIQNFPDTCDKMFQRVLNHLFSGYLSNNHLSLPVNHAPARIIYIYIPNNYPSSPITEINGSLKRVISLFSQQLDKFFSNISNVSSARIELEIFVPVSEKISKEMNDNGSNTKALDNNIAVHENYKMPTNHHQCDLSRKKNTFSSEVHYSSITKLWELFISKAHKHQGLVSVNIQGIPMLRTTTKTNICYDVMLACKAYAIEITQDINVTDSVINLNWTRSTQKSTIEHLYTTKSVHRVTPIHPYTQPSLCLMKHLAAGKPVLLCLESDYNIQHQHKVTHILLQHGSDVYLHVLHLSKSYQPWLTIPKPYKPVANYRVKEFMDIVRSHILYGPDESLFDRDVLTSSSEEEHSNMCLMKHNRFLYQTPMSIERHTRYFPLCQDLDSVLFNSETSISLMKEIQTLLDIIIKKPSVSELELKKAKKNLNKLYQAIQSNDTKLLPEYASNHTQRWDMYRKLWSELRMLIITLNHHSILALMDKLWPQFFYDNSTSSELGVKSQDQTRRNKRMIEVQRDRHGNVIFPIPLGSLTIHSLGKVIWDRPTYHTEKYIWPVGYKATRYYTSATNVEKRCLYTCEIRDGGDSPIFVLTSEDNAEEPIVASSATAAWTVIVKKVNEIKTEEQGKRVFTNVSGPEYFGLAHPTVMKLISELPNAEKCDRPNAPYQPAVKISSSSSGKEADIQEDLTDEIDVPDASLVVIKEVPDYEKNEGITVKQSPLSEKPQSLFDLIQSAQKSISKQINDFDGRNEGERALYSHATHQTTTRTPSSASLISKSNTTANQSLSSSSSSPLQPPLLGDHNESSSITSASQKRNLSSAEILTEGNPKLSKRKREQKSIPGIG